MIYFLVVLLLLLKKVDLTCYTGSRQRRLVPGKGTKKPPFFGRVYLLTAHSGRLSGPVWLMRFWFQLLPSLSAVAGGCVWCCGFSDGDGAVPNLCSFAGVILYIEKVKWFIRCQGRAGFADAG